MTVLSITDARNDLPKLVDRVSRLTQTVLITVQGKVKAALISAEELELMQETIEILSNETTMKNIRQGLAEIERGEGVPLEDVQKELNL